MKTTTILNAYIGVLQRRNMAFDHSRRQRDKFRATLISRIKAGDQAREAIEQMELERDYRPRMDDYERVLAERDLARKELEQLDKTREALKMVEWRPSPEINFDKSWVLCCPWCGKTKQHAPDCPRQLALGISNVTE